MRIDDAERITAGYERLTLERRKNAGGPDTIGYGHKCGPSDQRETVTMTEARSQLSRDYGYAFARAHRLLRRKAGATAAEAFEERWRCDDVGSRDAALLDMMVHRGEDEVAGFGGMWKAWRRNDWNRAGNALLFSNPDAKPPEATAYAKAAGGRARDNAHRIRSDREPRS